MVKTKYKTGDSIISECCKCGLRETWIFTVIRGKTPQDDIVKIDVFNVNVARNDLKGK